ncbi:YbhB/YbcL family Raf kinase inhibitor-like protein [Bifidobacterium subtile]|jgi:Raf kinase inhibitor-like YbhB/YbcL family protein|nr:YbhB/YbcL family Raf kinase inhibitor-like protein [Bifidobacterium subtile]
MMGKTVVGSISARFAELRRKLGVMQEFLVQCGGIGEDHRFFTEFTGRGDDISPSFHLLSIPEGTETLAIVLRDESHPIFGSMTHWLIWNLPVDPDIAANIAKGTRSGRGNARQGVAYGWHRYRGPKPPKGTTHRYVFTVYAVNGELDLGGMTTLRRLRKAMRGKVLGIGRVEGLFE